MASSATAWSQTMADSGNFKHGGGGFSGQNIGWSQGKTNVEWAHRGWMDSPGHCRNIMNPRWNYMGAGTATGQGRLYVTQNFG